MEIEQGFALLKGLKNKGFINDSEYIAAIQLMEKKNKRNRNK